MTLQDRSQGERWLLDAERKGEICGLLRAARRLLYFRSVETKHGIPPGSWHASNAFDIAAEWCRAEAAKLREAAGKKEGNVPLHAIADAEAALAEGDKDR